ncbi:hypothetical protein HY418_02295 [Candidatus Kaiserbacteria bacterium]|nr:hypothetical protein [Candidatus Kaiserbacteria bacterium]
MKRFASLMVFGIVVSPVVVAYALEATSTSEATTTPIVESDQIDTTATTSATTTTTEPPTTPEATETTATESSAEATTATTESTAPVEQPPAGLTEVKIIGTKYIDYFTDGTATYAFPGDPDIDAHLSEKNAATPTHEGMTWVHTTGQLLYDTASGDLEEGQYAVSDSGKIIAKPYPFVSSTSTPPIIEGATSPATSTTTEETTPTTPADEAATSTVEETPATVEESTSTATTTH